MAENVKIADLSTSSSIEIECKVNGAGTRVTIIIDGLGIGDGHRLGERLGPPVGAVVKAFYGERVKFVEQGDGPLPPVPEKSKMS